MTTYLIALRNAAGATIIEDWGIYTPDDSERNAMRRYRHEVKRWQRGELHPEVAEVALMRLDGDRRRSTIRSTRPQTSRAKAQLAMVEGVR